VTQTTVDLREQSAKAVRHKRAVITLKEPPASYAHVITTVITDVVAVRHAGSILIPALRWLPFWLPRRDRFSKMVGRTGFEPVTSSVSGILRDSSHLCQARSRCLRCCPRVTVTTLGLPPHRARGGHAHLGQMQRFGLSSRLVTIGRVKALMVFKSFGGSRPTIAATCRLVSCDGSSSKIVPRISRTGAAKSIPACW
jgi:hypothetical protein